ncbi:phage tail length tape-measure protein [Tetragenococcus muriaticus PMC-11-5]|uniref:Phage tail length tape-measure protein n=1 Tax=Tetragenococcus muriaticus PMC-11-5 TaxID=1302649 RepID=A0A091C3R0_9ENTE|nr:transglycosylase SLT domain-containing protein [Tetragenococcus muriaticus]KFN92451.1 phage tail length tape-measure protein [Tetragenococcus muriaticus PMC-11-5]
MSKKAAQIMINAAYDMVEDEAGAMFGEFDGDIYNGSITDAKGVYSYLVDIAKQVIKKFPNMSVTSGYRPNDPNYHGKRQAIDVAYPASMNGSSKYKDPANYAFSNFKDQVSYVIALNKIKDRTGMGGEGKTMSWANWPSGGHMDHLHINGMFGPGDVGKGGDGFAGGSGVGRWKKTAMRALKMTGDYTKSNLSALMAQMKSESNGNPKAVNNWDSNAARGTPSKGLMQVIQPTFDSYKMKGHGNILEPLDNILAAIRYTKSAYGSLKSGWRGAGYENGGLVSRHQIAEMGEGNKPEMVLPLTNKARSLDLIAKAMQIIGVDGGRTNTIGDIMNDLANKMIGGIANGVSGVRSGVNHILKEVDSDKRIDEWDVPKYAKGIKGGGRPADGPAIVNDQSGPVSRRRELIQNPDRSTFMAKAKNSLVNLQKGARVFNADMTNKLRKGGHIPRYKDGTDDTDVFDLVDDKGKFSKFIKGKINLDDFGEPWKDMSKKASKMMIDAAYDMVEDEASFGTFDGKMDKSGKWKVYNYLWDVAQKVMDKFPGMSVTSGYRDGDPNHHGKHQAIDIAYPASANGSNKYLKPANYAFDKFKDRIAYVITQGRVKDRVGSSGHGPSKNWMNWGSSDHDDHLHLSGQYGPGDVGKGGGKNGDWTEAINQAAKRMKVKPTKKQISGINSMIQAESGGDEKVSQQIHDVNSTNGSGGAKGLLQYIQSTFDAYAVKGHKNIWSGLDQLMAFFNNSNWKSAIAPSGGWGPTGSRRFEHGGLINRHMVAEMGEGNKPEMVLPLTNKARSLDLMAKAMQIMGVDDKNASSSSSFSLSVVTELLQENNRLTKQNTELLEQVRDKDNNTYLNDRKVSTGLGPSMDRVQGQRRKYKETGVKRLNGIQRHYF